MTERLFRISLLTFVASLVAAVVATPVFPQEDRVQAALDALVAAYPDALARHDGKSIYWRDGTIMAVSDGDADKPFSELLRNASIIDQFHVTYSRGPLE